MHRHAPWLVLSLALLASTSTSRADAPSPSPTPASTPNDADVARARALFVEGAQLAAASRWSEALARFEASSSLRPHATTTYNIAYCERALGRDTRAEAHFHQALAMDGGPGTGELTDETRAASAKYLDELKVVIATVDVSLDAADRTITVDGRPLEKSTESATDVPTMTAGTRDPGPAETAPAAHFRVRVDPGPHEILVWTADGRSVVTNVLLEPGETRGIDVVVPEAPLKTEAPGLGVRRTWSLVLGGAGVAAVGTGVVFALLARSSWNGAKDACPARTTCPDDRGAQLSSEATRRANMATALFVGGGAAIGSAVVLWITGAPKESEPPATGIRVVPGFASISVEGAF